MINVSPQDWELTEFFGVEPILQDPAAPFAYNCAIFRRAPIEFVFDPTRDRVRISFSSESVKVDLEWNEVVEVLLHTVAGNATLKIRSQSGSTPISLTIAPIFSVKHLLE